MHLAQKRLGVEVFVAEEFDENVPSCPHGPMLLFERYFESKPPRKFYSCSACRDRKDCGFFQWADEKVSAASKEAHKKIIKACRPPFDQKKCCRRFSDIKTMTDTQRMYCHSCDQLVLSDERSAHKDHVTVETISDELLSTPSHLLRPLEKKKFHAQYLFSDVTSDFLQKTLKNLGFKNVICVGTPRIHESIQRNRSRLKMDSLLLDLDHRYGQFNDDKHFVHYNMFNHHFFDETHAQNCMRSFFEKATLDSTLFVMDPPFGGLVQVLSSSLRKMWKYANDIFNANDSEKTEVSTFWIFPYFMESHIVEELPSFQMCDYKVDYDNHPLYKKPHGKSNKTSPVRIFTNLSLKRLVLPKNEGYRYCDQCERYVNEKNVHCGICNDCTSKDGRVWIHCAQCEKCVKQGREHCVTCNRCDLPRHTCELRNLRGCHVCGKLDHKRKHCPEKQGEGNKSKRAKSTSSKKRRKTS